MEPTVDINSLDMSFVFQPGSEVDECLRTVSGKAQEILAFLGRHSQLSEKSVFYLNLAFEELATNVARHSLPRAKAPLTVTCGIRITGSRVSMVLMDDGQAFDVTTAKPPVIDVPAEERMVGGLGLYLIKKAFPVLAYSRTNGWNEVQLIIDT